MKLFKVTTEYKIKEVIEGLLELSEHHFNMRKESIACLGLCNFWQDFMPRINFGRQTGQTDAILDIALIRPEKTLIVVHNQDMVNYVKRHDNLIVMSVKVLDRKHSRSVILDSKIDTIIFDCCSYNDIENAMWSLMLHKNNVKRVISVSQFR